MARISQNTAEELTRERMHQEAARNVAELQRKYDTLRSKLEAEIATIRKWTDKGAAGTRLLRKLGYHDLAGRNAAMGKRAVKIADRLQAILSDVEGGEHG